MSLTSSKRVLLARGYSFAQGAWGLGGEASVSSGDDAGAAFQCHCPDVIAL